MLVPGQLPPEASRRSARKRSVVRADPFASPFAGHGGYRFVTRRKFAEPVRDSLMVRGRRFWRPEAFMRSKPPIAAGPRSDPLPASDRRITVDHIDDQTGEATTHHRADPACAGPACAGPAGGNPDAAAPSGAPHRRRHLVRHRARHRRRTVSAIRVVSLSALCTAFLAVTALGWVALHGGAAATIGSSNTAARWSQERALRSGSQGNVAGLLGHFKRVGHLAAATTRRPPRRPRWRPPRPCGRTRSSASPRIGRCPRAPASTFRAFRRWPISPSE